MGLEINKIHKGLTEELIKQMDDKSINLIVTSPDYANTVNYGKKVKLYNENTFADWFIPVIKDFYDKLADDGSFIMNINDKVSNGERSIYVMDLVCRIVRETDFKLYDRYIWGKKAALPTGGNKRLNDRIEYIFHFVKSPKDFYCDTNAIREPYAEASVKRFDYKVMANDVIDENGLTDNTKKKKVNVNPLGKVPGTLFQFNTAATVRDESSGRHPAPFNPELPEFFVKWLTRENDLVLDPFNGVASTGVATYNNNRNYIGFDMNELYIDISKERLNKFNKLII